MKTYSQIMYNLFIYLNNKKREKKKYLNLINKTQNTKHKTQNTKTKKMEHCLLFFQLRFLLFLFLHIKTLNNQ